MGIAGSQQIVTRWAVKLKTADFSAGELGQQLGRLRGVVDCRIAQAGNDTWLLGTAADEVPSAVRSLRGMHFEVMEGGQLREFQHRVPSARLPELNWFPLHDWLIVERPVAALATATPDDVPARRLRLVRGGAFHEPEGMLVTLEALCQFAGRAPAIRLQRLRLAANDAGDAFVWGKPMLPLPGRQFVVVDRVAVPVGFIWQPAVDSLTLRRAFGVDDELLLWHSTDQCDVIPQEEFVKLTRSAVRETLQRQQAERA